MALDEGDTLRACLYAGLAIGEARQVMAASLDWALDAWRRFADEYEGSIDRFDDEKALGSYGSDARVLDRIADLLLEGLKFETAARQALASISGQAENMVNPSECHRLRRIWNKTWQPIAKTKHGYVVHSNRWHARALRRKAALDIQQLVASMT